MNARIRHLRENVHIVCLVAMLGTSPWGHAADGAWEQAGYSAGGLFPVIVADPGIDITGGCAAAPHELPQPYDLPGDLLLLAVLGSGLVAAGRQRRWTE